MQVILEGFVTVLFWMVYLHPVLTSSVIIGFWLAMGVRYLARWHPEELGQIILRTAQGMVAVLLLTLGWLVLSGSIIAQ